MAEACTDSRRCLPSWMLKGCSSNELSKTEDRNKQELESDKQPGALDQIKPVRRKSVRQVKTVDTEDAGEPRALRQCQGREKARRKSKDHAVKDEETEKITGKNVRQMSGRAAPKNGRKRKLEHVGSEASSSGTTDDEIELTVEDLVSIAEEIVNAGKEKQQELQTTKTARYEEHPLSPPISTAADTGGLVLSTRPMKGLMGCTTTTTNTAPGECRVDKNNGNEEVHRSSSIKMTGDVAQDMLNIFLGPLLSKPAAYERKSEAIESITMNINHAPAEERLTERSTKSGATCDKKKSSLKDKVALFL